MRLRRLLPVLLAPWLSGGLEAQQYGLRTFSLEEGLPSASVNALCEDRDGFLWVATEAGAARSEGLRFEVSGRRQGLPVDEVTALYCAADSTVWLGCRNGAIATWRHGRVRVLDLPGMPTAPIRRFATDGHGRLHAATLGAGIVRIGNEALHRLAVPGGHARDLAALPDGRLLAATDSGLFLVRENGVEAAGGITGPVFALHTDSIGVLVGTTSGYRELTPDLHPVPPAQRFAGFHPIALPDPRVLCILRARNGDLWVGTPSGLMHLSRRQGSPELRTMTERNGLGNDVVRALLQDRSGAIWAGTAFGGVSKFTGDAFMHFTERDGLRSRIVTAIHRTPEGLLWFGTMGGGVARWQDGGPVNHGANEGLADPLVLCLGEDGHGNLLAGTATRGLFKLNGERFQPVPLPVNGPLRVFAVRSDSRGRIHAATDQGLWRIDPRGRPQRYTGGPAVVNSLVIGRDTLWAATAEGLFTAALHDAPPVLIRHAPVPPVALLAMERDGAGNLWIGTDGHGLYRVQGSRVDSIGTADGLASPVVEQVLLDAWDNVWLGTRRGFHLVELDALQERIIGMRQYGTEEGFIGIEAFRNACMTDVDSTLWFGSVRGATRFDPRREMRDTCQPLLHLTGLELFFDRPDWTPWCSSIGPDGFPRGLRLPHHQNHLTFTFTGISLAYPEKVRYRFMLEGYDPDWSPITGMDRVTYSNLPPGEYTFKLLARNGSGVWTEEPLTWSFGIAPPFWATTGFRLGAGAFVALGAFGLVRRREQRLRRDRERLERTVQQRTRELAAEKERSEELLHNILPAATAAELKAKGRAEARRHEHCTVLFSDFKGFTSFSGRMDSDTLVSELHHYFSLFDRLCAEHGLEKIKTIGDAYMCAAGLPEPVPHHALRAVLMAFGMLEAVERSNAERRAKGLQEWPVRIGLHSGPVVAGVVGTRKFAYDIWGDTVNLASRMEANGEAGRVNISGPVYAQVMEYIEAQPRGPIKVKGKGEVQMYFALRLKKELSADARGLRPNTVLLQRLASLGEAGPVRSSPGTVRPVSSGT